MTSQQFERVQGLFRQACALPVHERAAFLVAQCPDDADVRAKVERMLAQVEAQESGEDRGEDGGFLESPALGRGFHVAPIADLDRRLETEFAQIGRYTIVRKIGEGGMGTVYEARQEHPSRTVALKIIRPGIASAAMLKRFTHEAQILGQLQHPGIACIHEAGVADIHQGPTAGTGALPIQIQFFAMELVRGQTLTDYAAEQRLSTPERLEVFARICDAVQHAHQKGVIHRDLKPANILVVEDADAAAPGAHGRIGQPKVLDFGVARLTDADTQNVTLQTDVGQLIGTIPYMSPEQVLGDSRVLDVRSDVYALGVILYELLASRLPLDLRNRSIAEATRIIREEEPSRLSSIDTRFRGDIETIVGKALEKDRERRYQSAADLAADVRHYLREEPILARPATASYRLRKFARRNKVLVASSAVVLVVLIAGIISTSVGLIRARAAEKRAISEANQARAINAFLNEDLISAVEKLAKGHDVGMREILNEAAKRIESKFSGQPAVEAEIRCSLGQAYTYLGEFETAQKHLERALMLDRNGARMNTDSHVAIILTVGMLRHNQGRYAEAESLQNEALQESIRINGETDWRTLKIMNSQAMTYQRLNRPADAEALYQRLIKIRRAIGDAPDNQKELLTVMSNLGTLYRVQNRLDEALSIQTEVLEKANALLGPESPVSLKCAYDLGFMLRKQGRLNEAEARLAPLETIMRRKMGESHPHTLFVVGELSSLRMDQGRLDEALRLRTENVEGLRRALGETHSDTQNCIRELAKLYDAMSRPQDAASWRAKLVSAAPTPTVERKTP